MKFFFKILIFNMFWSSLACASTYPRVDADIAMYDSTVLKMRNDFSAAPSNIEDKEWIKSKLDYMFKIDQYVRAFSDTPFINNYSPEEKSEFHKQFGLKFYEVDNRNTSDLKELLKRYEWFKISEFGIVADNQAWIIVQHADIDPAFQKQILTILEKLWLLGETKPANYAYLYDRVASSFSDPSKMVPQRYGTQGRCVGPETWEPWPIEDEVNVDKRRKSVGLGAMEEYKSMFKTICH